MSDRLQWLLYAIVMVQGLAILILFASVRRQRQWLTGLERLARRQAQSIHMIARILQRNARPPVRPLTKEELERLDDGDNAWFHDTDMGSR